MLLNELERAVFTNRDELLALLHHNASLAQAGSGVHLALVGKRRIGKTMLIQRFADDLVESRSPLIPVYFNVADNLSVPSVFSMRLLASLGRSFARSNGSPEEQTSGMLTTSSLQAIANQTREKSIVTNIQKVVRELNKERPDERMVLETSLSCLEQTALETGRKLLIILDEFHNVTHLDSFPHIKDTLSVLGDALCKQSEVHYLAVSSNASMVQRSVHSEASPLYNQFQIVPIPPFSQAAANEFCEKKLSKNLQQPETLARLFQFTAGHPFYLSCLTAAIGRLEQSDTTSNIVDRAIFEDLLMRDGRIFLFCLHRFETALAEARGKTTLRSVLLVLADGGTQTLSEIARLLKRTPGEVRSYLKRLADFDLIKRDGHNYFITDPILALWIKFTIVGPVPEYHSYKDIVRNYLGRLPENGVVI